MEALSTSCLHWALSLSGAPLVWPLSRVVALFSQFSWTLEMGKELVVNLGHVLHLCLYSSYWLSGKRQRRRAFLKVVLFRSSTLSPSARPQVTCSHPLCVWRWADSLLFTTNPFLPPGPSVFTRRISLTSWPWVFYLLVTFSLPEPPSPVVTPWILHPRKLLSF